MVRNADTEFSEPLNQTQWSCWTHSNPWTIPSLFSINWTRIRSAFCDELQVSEERDPQLPSLDISVLLGVGIISNNLGLLGNSGAVISLHLSNDLFNMSS